MIHRDFAQLVSLLGLARLLSVTSDETSLENSSLKRGRVMDIMEKDRESEMCK